MHRLPLFALGSWPPLLLFSPPAWAEVILGSASFVGIGSLALLVLLAPPHRSL